VQEFALEMVTVLLTTRQEEIGPLLVMVFKNSELTKEIFYQREMKSETRL